MPIFRATPWDGVFSGRMSEMTYGWNLEMQMRAARAKLRILEVPVNHRRRAGGTSKVSGTVRGTFLAAGRIALTLARVAIERPVTDSGRGSDEERLLREFPESDSIRKP